MHSQDKNSIAASSWTEASRTKVIPPEKIADFGERMRREGKTIATINGSYDLLHAGHLYILYEAAKVADILVVALNTDASIKRYKSEDRPIIPLEQRLEMLSAIFFVDYLCYFDEDDPREFLRTLRPHVHINGEEYGHDCIEAETLKEIGAKLHLVKRIPGLATSDIIKKIQAL